MPDVGFVYLFDLTILWDTKRTLCLYLGGRTNCDIPCWMGKEVDDTMYV